MELQLLSLSGLDLFEFSEPISCTKNRIKDLNHKQPKAFVYFFSFFLDK